MRPAARAASAAISRCVAPSRLCRSRCPQAQGNATSWNITHGAARRRSHSQPQNSTFIAFQPYMCGTYCTSSRCGPGPRSTLETVLRRLPAWAQPEFRQVIGPIDELFLARTLQDPCADPGVPWWEQRIATR